MNNLSWLRAAVQRNREGIEGCGLYLQLWDADTASDPLPVLQTGLAVLLDKPIYLVVPPGGTERLPGNLQRLARGILEADVRTHEGREQIAAWTKRISEDV